MKYLSEKQLVALAVVALLFILWAYYYPFLPEGALKHIDEYWTLDRVGSFVRTQDWFTVHSRNQVNFNKPPLQYWISAYFLQNGFDLEYALRLPSFLFSIGLLLATGFLAYQLCSRLIIFPVSIFILASSFRYWESALSALLDMGATFLATVALVAFFAAMRQPKWWYLVALSAGVSAMQKAPIALAGVVMASGVTVIWHLRYKIPDYRRVYLNKHFWLSVGLLLLLLLVWPVLQLTQHGFAFLQQAYSDQMWNRFAAAEGLAENSEVSWGQGLGLFRAQPLLEVPFILAIMVLPFVIKRAESYVLTAMFLAYVVLGVIAGKHGSPRYILILYPAMAASLSAIMTHYLDRKAMPVAVIYSLIIGTPLKSIEKLGLTRSTQAPYFEFLSSIKKAMRDNETFVRCRWSRGRRPIFAGAISYYASNGKPIFVLRAPDRLNASHTAPPYRGICTADEFADLVKWLDTPVQVEAFGNYVHWTAQGPASAKN